MGDRWDGDQDQRYYGIEKGYRVVERRGTFVDSDIQTYSVFQTGEAIQQSVVDKLSVFFHQVVAISEDTTHSESSIEQDKEGTGIRMGKNFIYFISHLVFSTPPKIAILKQQSAYYYQ